MPSPLRPPRPWTDWALHFKSTFFSCWSGESLLILQELIRKSPAQLLAPFLLQTGKGVAFFVLSASPRLSNLICLGVMDICFLDYELPEGRDHVYSSLYAPVTDCLYVLTDWMPAAERNTAWENNSSSTKCSGECNQVHPRLANGESWLKNCSKRSPDLIILLPEMWLKDEEHFHYILVRGNTDWNLSTPVRHHSNYLHESSYNRRSGKEHGTNKPPPTGRIWERSKWDATCPTNFPEPSLLESLLAEQCMGHEKEPSVRMTG